MSAAVRHVFMGKEEEGIEGGRKGKRVLHWRSMQAGVCTRANSSIYVSRKPCCMSMMPRSTSAMIWPDWREALNNVLRGSEVYFGLFEVTSI